MLSQGESRCGADFEYVKSLLQERRQELKGLELRYGRKQIQREEYLSCSRALLQGIGELDNLLRNDSEHVQFKSAPKPK